MTTIYLIRHAEAEGNLYRRAQGFYDSNITPFGRKQIAALAERFKNIPVDVLWASDLSRTQSTASAILKYHPELKLQISPELKEFGIGIMEDQPWGNLGKDYPTEMEYFSTDPAKYKCSGSELYYDSIFRVKNKIMQIAAENDGKTVVIVSHGMVIRGLIANLSGYNSKDIHNIPHGDNTSVALLSYNEGELVFQYYNDNSHLDETTSTFAKQTWWRKKDGVQKDFDNVVFSPLDPSLEPDLYLHCYEETWKEAHGSTAGFVPEVYLSTAKEHFAESSQNIVCIRRNGEFVGMIELDSERGRKDNAGWIVLIYVEKEFRNRRLGVQLYGHAVSCFRAMNYDKIRLHVAETNLNAIGFYSYYDFKTIGNVQGVGSMLYQMQVDIVPRIWFLS